MMARRRRRISSSLLPENIGPQMTSIHPTLPVMMSMNDSGYRIAAQRDARDGLFQLFQSPREEVVARLDPMQLPGLGDRRIHRLHFGTRRVLIVRALHENLGRRAGVQIFRRAPARGETRRQ